MLDNMLSLYSESEIKIASIGLSAKNNASSGLLVRIYTSQNCIYQSISAGSGGKVVVSRSEKFLPYSKVLIAHTNLVKRLQLSCRNSEGEVESYQRRPIFAFSCWQ